MPQLFKISILNQHKYKSLLVPPPPAKKSEYKKVDPKQSKITFMITFIKTFISQVSLKLNQ